MPITDNKRNNDAECNQNTGRVRGRSYPRSLWRPACTCRSVRLSGTGICDCSALHDEQSNDNVSRLDWTIKPSSTPLALVIGACGSWTRTSAVMLRGAETWRSGDDPCVGAGEKIRWAKMPHTVVMRSQGSLAYDRFSRDPCTRW
jgi:hypothetical protein